MIMKTNYSIEDALKKMLISKNNVNKINKVEYNDYDLDKLFKKQDEREWEKTLDSIDIKFIENYVRKKKLLNLENKK